MSDVARTDDGNLTTYRSAGIVRHYAQLQQLQPAEETILELLKGQWADWSMLDIGVGAGRTTKHFAHRVAQYVGVDYSADMVAACVQRFPGAKGSDQVRFDVCDARDLSQFADDSFDFVLFSYNGIDSVSHDDRLQVFREVQRVGKPGGYFCFSSHHLTAMARDFDWGKQWSWNPGKTYVNLMMTAILHGVNWPTGLKQIQAVPYALLKDESHTFRLKHYYIRAAAQLEQLQEWFGEVKVYGWNGGVELETVEAMDGCMDLWLYYLCRVK
ncbi:class I SAM-dependent methyltransferase [filamentous cyanobacterium LEGE 11480]|uniref:Class I SAM-dependent methyltransferase n=1 Tax=Romeriopsis navalis LEGE 11480 TaxID=2777977 RepID=A0A928VNN7_9CYAN|nr:class I SAM-dependent methyltransferase [Romeriopsis navalis]MBE9031866.1 class I SAM-dependent methyltransferase [Romeriopsis navalis LEGE 11480]